TPMAFADGEMRASLLGEKGVRERDLAIARVLLGSSIMGYAAYKTLAGDMNGEYPRDPKEQKRWRQNGTLANSARVGDWWVSMNKFGPLTNLMQLAADFMGVAHIIGDEDENKAMRSIWHMSNAAFNLVKNETGFVSVAMFMDATSSV